MDGKSLLLHIAKGRRLQQSPLLRAIVAFDTPLLPSNELRIKGFVAHRSL
jgi:hypothetical protein